MLSSILPPPKNNFTSSSKARDEEDNEDIAPTSVPVEEAKSSSSSSKKNKKVIPSYPSRKGFVPLEASDYGDGGAYPEIHVVQYPLNMGKQGQKSKALIPVQVDENGTMRTDMIVKQGTNSNKIVHSHFNDLKEKRLSAEELAAPTEQEEMDTAERTRRALEAIVEGKIKSSKPSSVGGNNSVVEPSYVRYTPNPNAPGANPATQQRVIKMVEAQVDPMEPPKHKHSKVHKGSTSPPVPVLHSPPRKLTVEDQQAWKIPPCISNWKNARGFIIPLDKRLAADGRGLEEVTINNKFAMLSESLYIAERKAVQDLNVRNELRKNIALREKEEREQNLREMANRARLERTGAIKSKGDGERNSDSESDFESEDETEEERRERLERDKFRLERRKEHERQMRLDNMKGNMRKNKMERDEGRDVSEKIALGMLKGTGKLSGEALYDSRLFNQTGGMDSGFGAEDDYNAYSKPLFDRGDGATIYRPKKSDSEAYGNADEQLSKLKDTNKFRPDKGFKGAEVSEGPRDGPVQFERDDGRRRHDDYDDSRSKKARYHSDSD